MLLGLEPYEITRLVEERQAMLASVREGVLAVDDQARITLVNPAAERLLVSTGLGKPPLGRPIAEYLPTSGLPEVLASASEQLDREFSLNGLAILANRAPIRHQGRVIGAIATFRDKSEVNALAEQLTGVSRYAEALRAATHEFRTSCTCCSGWRRWVIWMRCAPTCATSPITSWRPPRRWWRASANRSWPASCWASRAKPASAASFSRWRSNIRSRPPRRNGSTAW